MRNDNTYTWTDYYADLTHAVLPWIVFAVFAFVILIAAIVFRFLRCMCCKKQIKQRGRCIRLTCVLFSFIATFLALLSCCFIIYYSDQTFQSFEQVQCASGRIPYAITNGNSPKNWTGLNQALVDVNNSTYVLQNYYTNSTQALWNGTSWMATTSFDQAIGEYNTSYVNHTVYNPNPMESQGILTRYTANIGPVSNGSSYAGMVNSEFYVKLAPIIATMQDLSAISTAFEGNVSGAIGLMQSAAENLTTFVVGTNKINANIDAWVLNNQDQIITSWRGFTFAVVIWGWFICIGVLIAVYSQGMNKPLMAHGLCCFWLFTGLIAVFGFLASAGTLAAGLVTENSCGLLDDLFTSGGLATYGVIVPSDIVVYVDTCLNQGGGLASALNLTVFLNYLQLFATDNATLAAYNINPGLGVFTSLYTNTHLLQSPIDYLAVADPSVPTADTPLTNLNLLNEYTNNYSAPTFQSSCTSFASDYWVFYQTACAGYVYVPSTSPVAGLGSKSCLVISEWSSSQVKERYVPYMQCTYSGSLGDYTETLLAYQEALGFYQVSVDTLYAQMNSSLESIGGVVAGMAQNLTNQEAGIVQYFNSPTQLLYLMNSVLGPQGLANGLNCSFVHEYSVSLQSAMCVNSLENIYDVFVYVFLLSFFMLCLEIINLYLSRALLKGEEVYY